MDARSGIGQAPRSLAELFGHSTDVSTGVHRSAACHYSPCSNAGEVAFRLTATAGPAASVGRGLLVSKGVDRVESSGLARGIETEENSNGGGESDR